MLIITGQGHLSDDHILHPSTALGCVMRKDISNKPQRKQLCGKVAVLVELSRDKMTGQKHLIHVVHFP